MCTMQKAHDTKSTRYKKRAPFRKARRLLYFYDSRPGLFYFTVTDVMWGFTPSYQYRKPSASMVSPTFKFFTA